MQTRLTAHARGTTATTARPDSSRQRVLFVSLLLALWMLAIGARLVYLQTFQHEWLSAKAQQQQQNEAQTASGRGLILDRANRELARSATVESIYADPAMIADLEIVSAQLAPLLDTQEDALISMLRAARQKNRRFVWLARKVDATRAEAVASLKLPGISSVKESKRVYPHGSLAAHVLGFVGTDEVGLGGVEQIYNASLVGEGGRTLVESDGRRRPFKSFDIAPRTGRTVQLTIDQAVQYHAEQIMADALARTRARAATAVVLDPRSGEILALVNAPSFDPNSANRVTPQMRTNEALQNIYEPGSTFKIVAYSAAIEEGLARPDERVDCQMGSITIANRVVHDHHPYGSLTLTEALAKSSNVAAIKMGLRVGNERMYEYIKRFGFGARTGVELPGETAGLLRQVRRWQPSSIGSIAIGQEIGVTPVQIAGAFATLANDGVRVAPHIVRAVKKADDTTEYQAQPEQRRVISAKTARALRGMLESVTLSGTAKQAQLDGYTAAGKTGTAQKIDPRTRAYSKTKYVASFVGLAPVTNPAVVIAVIVDEPVGSYHGGDVAAPIFRELAERVLPLLNVTPDAEFKEPPAQPSLVAGQTKEPDDEIDERDEETGERAQLVRRASGDVVYAPAAQRALSMPDLRGRSLRDAAHICAQLGLQLEARGEGRILRQQPHIGAEVESGQTVRVELGKVSSEQ